MFYLPNVITAPKAAPVINVAIAARGASNMRFHEFRTFAKVTATEQIPATALCRYQGQLCDLKDFGCHKVDRCFVPSVVEPSALKYQSILDSGDRVEYQSSVSPQDDTLDPLVTHESDVLVSGQDYPVTAVNYGEEIASVRALLQKFSYVGTAQLQGTGALGTPNYFTVAFPPPVGQNCDLFGVFSIAPSNANVQLSDIFPTGNSGVLSPWNIASHYLAMFCGYRGGFRVKLVPRNGTNDSTTTPAQCPTRLACHVLSATQAWHLEINHSVSITTRQCPVSPHVQYMHTKYGETIAEVEIPYYSPNKLVPTGMLNARANDFPNSTAVGLLTNARLLVTLGQTDGPNAVDVSIRTYEVHTAAKSDCQVGAFYRVPGVRVI